MKKILLLSVLLLLLFACGKQPKEVPTEPTDLTEATEPTEAAKESRLSFENRPLAVMIDNDSDKSRPHAGLEDAFLLYEMYVEGNATRIMALFLDTDTEKIGPVRSSRHYFLDYANDSNALYAHAGWSPYAQRDIARYGVNNLNGLVYDGTYFWRERKYRGDYHSLFTSTQKLTELAKKRGYETKGGSAPLEYATESITYMGTEAQEIIIPYANFYKLSYTYNPQTRLYERFINSQPHTTQAGAALAAKSIIIQVAKSYAYGDGSDRIQLETADTGEGYYISDGKCSPITWEREERRSKLNFYIQGVPLKVSSEGQTYIQVVPSKSKVTIYPEQ
ncbi:MAG: DUF3048 domain-containing protein [Clostridia bacterium]|nr:DUF3048 domain-containing protein [Clostridia bacterium]